MYPNFLKHMKLSANIYMCIYIYIFADYGIKVEPILSFDACGKAYSCMSIFTLLRDNINKVWPPIIFHTK